MIVVGLDLSLTATGVYSLEAPQGAEPWVGPCDLLKSKPKDGTVEERILLLFRALSKFASEHGHPSIIVIEGPAFAAQGNAGAYTAALNFYFRCRLTDIGATYHVIPPTTLKKFATGRGNAQKSLMLQRIYKRWGIDVEDDNLADAYALARYGHEVLGSPGAATNGAVACKK